MGLRNKASKLSQSHSSPCQKKRREGAQNWAQSLFERWCVEDDALVRIRSCNPPVFHLSGMWIRTRDFS